MSHRSVHVAEESFGALEERFVTDMHVALRGNTAVGISADHGGNAAHEVAKLIRQIVVIDNP